MPELIDLIHASSSPSKRTWPQERAHKAALIEAHRLRERRQADYVGMTSEMEQMFLQMVTLIEQCSGIAYGETPKHKFKENLELVRVEIKRLYEYERQREVMRQKGEV